MTTPVAAPAGAKLTFSGRNMRRFGTPWRGYEKGDVVTVAWSTDAAGSGLGYVLIEELHRSATSDYEGGDDVWDSTWFEPYES